jgi:hypothetical protein
MPDIPTKIYIRFDNILASPKILSTRLKLKEIS